VLAARTIRSEREVWTDRTIEGAHACEGHFWNRTTGQALSRAAQYAASERNTQMDITTLLIIVVLIMLLGGGGWYGRGRWY
jgi:hypothetical protein